MDRVYSFFILERLKRLGLLEGLGDWWWENALSVEVVLGSILTQNTKWDNVVSSLKNLKNANILTADNNQSLENIATSKSIESLISPSGFFRQKSARIIALANAILADFGDFETFSQSVSREWLLGQKGIGFESADSILNYACGREVMVVDKYTFIMLRDLGIEIEDYNELQAWFMDLSLKDVYSLYDDSMPLAQVYARYHGKIVEFSKKKMPVKSLLTT